MVTKELESNIVDLSDIKPLRLPSWLKQSKTKSKATKKLSQWLERGSKLYLSEAKCPNRGECFLRGFDVFDFRYSMPRNCAFCSVRHGKPMPPDLSELNQILHAIETLNLRFVVLTSQIEMIYRMVGQVIMRLLYLKFMRLTLKLRSKY